MKRLLEILYHVQPFAAWIAVGATIFSAGYFYARIEIERDGHIRHIESRLAKLEGSRESGEPPPSVQNPEQSILADDESRTGDSISGSSEGANEGANESDQLMPFAHRGRVRCPGGGDWLSRERNSKSQTVRYETPSGETIEERKFQVISNNFGSYGELENIYGINDAVIGVKMRISCDPPNYPGAAGGWLEVEISGKYQPRP